MIKINCGSCKFYGKKCEIRAKFRETAKQIKLDLYERFELKCPKKHYKWQYNVGDNVEFTFGYGKHKYEFEWVNVEGDVTIFVNNGYEGYVKIKGKIYSPITKSKYIISVHKSEFEKHKHLFNDLDIQMINEIQEKITIVDYSNDKGNDIDFNIFDVVKKHKSDYYSFVSKSKFIKLV